MKTYYFNKENMKEMQKLPDGIYSFVGYSQDNGVRYEINMPKVTIKNGIVPFGEELIVTEIIIEKSLEKIQKEIAEKEKELTILKCELQQVCEHKKITCEFFIKSPVGDYYTLEKIYTCSICGTKGEYASMIDKNGNIIVESFSLDGEELKNKHEESKNV